MRKLVLLAVAAVLMLPGCFMTKIKLFSDGSDPLQEFVIEGKGKEKILIIPVNGTISDEGEHGFIKSRPSIVHDVVSQLRLAADNPDIRAVILKVNSPGGTITASDILYNEIKTFKEKSGKKLIVEMMDMATSGAYYISLPADFIVAHPTTLTGSVGVIFMRPKVGKLMDKIGVSVEVTKSGEKKDLGSPFNETTPEEQAFFKGIIDEYAQRFFSLVKKDRKLNDESMKEVMTASVFLPEKAKSLGLIDAIGYMPDAIAQAKKLAGLSEASVIMFRRDAFANDTVYNSVSGQAGIESLKLVDINVSLFNALPAGYYYFCPMFLTAE